MSQYNSKLAEMALNEHFNHSIQFNVNFQTVSLVTRKSY